MKTPVRTRTVQTQYRPQQQTVQFGPQSQRTPAQFDVQGLVAGIMTVAQGAIAIAQGIQQIDRSCPGICEPYREDWR